MAKFFYKAKNFSGKYISGNIEGKNEKEIATSLRKEGFILISLEREGRNRKKRNIYIPFLNKVSISDKIVFTRNLKVLIGAGISLPRAMKILSSQTKNRKFEKVINDIGEKLNQGTSLSDALSNHSDVFSDIFSSMIKAGEESGTMENALAVLIEQMEKSNEIKQKVKGALIYPSVIILSMIIIGVLMIILIVPKLAETFEELNMELPFSTRIIVGTGNLFANYWYIILILFILSPFLLRAILKTKTGKKSIDKFFLITPMISVLVKKINSAHFVRTLSALISSGVPIVKSLEIVSETSNNFYYKKAITEASLEMKKGKKLAESLKEFENIFSPLVIQMIEVGEETGETSSILKKLADFYEEEVSNTTRNLSSIIEPVLMLIIGGAVGFFAISMIQPIYSIISAI